jgi:hypothetical protein
MKRSGKGKQFASVTDGADDFALRLQKLGTSFDKQPVIIGEQNPWPLHRILR